MSDFHFAAARITTAQICRAAGIERSARNVLDSLTDVLAKYLEKLGEQAAEAAEDRGDDTVNVSDAMLAIAQCGAVRRRIFAVDPDGVEDIVEILRWLRGPVQQRLVRTARPQRQQHSTVAASQGAALAALPSSTAAAATAEASSGADGVGSEEASRPNNEKTDADHSNGAPRLTDARNDWLRALLNQQIVLGHRDRFLNTEFGGLAEPDITVYGEDL